MTLPALPVTPALAHRLQGTPLVVLLDIDGTLSPIAPTPQDATVPEATRVVVEQLAHRPGVHLALVSGRAASDAKTMVRVDDVWVIGNHGMERLDPAGAWQFHESVAAYRDAIAAAAAELTAAVAGIPGAIVENKQLTLSVHYRLVAADDVWRVREIVTAVADRYGLRVVEGKKVLELRPPVEVNKGTAVVELALQLRALDERASVLYAGDDRTDEDAFARLRSVQPRSVTVHVGALRQGDRGGESTAAEFSVADPAEMRAFLEWVLANR